MAELVGISEGYKYQHNVTKMEKLIYLTCWNTKFAILFEQITYNAEEECLCGTNENVLVLWCAWVKIVLHLIFLTEFTQQYVNRLQMIVIIIQIEKISKIRNYLSNFINFLQCTLITSKGFHGYITTRQIPE